MPWKQSTLIIDRTDKTAATRFYDPSVSTSSNAKWIL